MNDRTGVLLLKALHELNDNMKEVKDTIKEIKDKETPL